jgi:hypothetical protein
MSFTRPKDLEGEEEEEEEEEDEEGDKRGSFLLISKDNLLKQKKFINQ